MAGQSLAAHQSGVAQTLRPCHQRRPSLTRYIHHPDRGPYLRPLEEQRPYLLFQSCMLLPRLAITPISASLPSSTAHSSASDAQNSKPMSRICSDLTVVVIRSPFGCGEHGAWTPPANTRMRGFSRESSFPPQNRV